MKFTDLLPYFFSAFSALVAGLWSYFGARKQAKDEIDRLVKQHELDLDTQKKLFEMELQKMELEHKHKLELLQQEIGGKAGADFMTSVFSAALNTPEAKQQISQSIRKGNTRNKGNGKR